MTPDFRTRVARAAQHLRETNTAMRAEGGEAPSDAAPSVHLQVVLIGLDQALATEDWEMVAQALVLGHELALRFRGTAAVCDEHDPEEQWWSDLLTGTLEREEKRNGRH